MRNRPGRLFLCQLTVLILCVAKVAVNATLVRYPYVQNVNTGSATIAWMTDNTGDSKVNFAEGGCSFSQSTTNSSVTNRHWVNLTGLRSGTKYYYQVLSNNLALTGCDWFETAPGPADAKYANFHFSVVGDSGFNKLDSAGTRWIYDGVFEPDPAVNSQVRVANVMKNYPLDLMLMTGDNIYESGQDFNYDPQIFLPYKDIIKNIPLFPSLGNHDYGGAASAPVPPGDEGGAPFFRNFYLPAHQPANTNPPEAYYSFDYGNAHFSVVDAANGGQVSYTAGSPQMQWLLQDLQGTSKVWKIVYFHFPVYSSTMTSPASSIGNTVAQMQANVEPVLLQGGADVVFNGHTHNYQRTYPVANGRIDQTNGIIYVVTGGGGKSADSITMSPSPYMAVTLQKFHFVNVHVNGNTMSIQAISDTNAVIDSFSITKSGTPALPAAPSNLAATAVSASQINLTWQDNSSDETGFKIQRKTGSGGTYSQIATVGAGVTSYNNTGLSANVTYFYRISATNAQGDSGFSNEDSAITNLTPPAAPRNLRNR